ncbi:MAG TPA: tripartite tricarboxylate transporter substrate binding protein, partial [Burkholderiales bacterium]|nr:tripartite tricarboxylate transporter substrate binding protein [Burkholderiales bacterium]
ASAAQDAAKDWPRRPVRLVVPFTAGGGNDITARIIAQPLTDELGQQFIVDNRPGGAGNIGMEIVARSQPDGYTIVVGNVSTNAINPTGFKTVLKFDPQNDLAAVSMVSRIPNLLVSGAGFPPTTMKELVDYAKARPGQLNYSSPLGGYSHLDMLDFNTKAGLQMVNVPSKGAGASFAAIIGGEIHASFMNAATSTPQVKGGRMKAFATTAQKRLSDLPDVPTMSEAGFPNTGSELWVGFFVPSKTPRAVVQKLHAAIVKVTQQQNVRDSFIKAQVPLAVSKSPEEFQAYVREEVQRWAKIIRDNKVTFQ